MKLRIKKLILHFVIIFTMVLLFDKNYILAKSKKTENDKFRVLTLLKIIDNDNDMDKPIEKKDFAKIIVKSSVEKDKNSDVSSIPVCTDVDLNIENAQYIKTAIENNYMFTYLGGYFYPNNLVSFNDLSRACLSLLGYSNKDFTGNRVKAFTNKFIELGLNENINKNNEDIVTKQDICNAIYNTLKENKKDSNSCYGLSIFDKLVKDSDGELNADESIDRKTEGPFIARTGNNKIDIEVPFDKQNAIVFINGIKYKINDVEDDLENYGYVIYYYDKINEIIYAYSERVDIRTTIAIKKAYVDKINYNANSMITPISININGEKYIFANEDMKLKFSYTGSIKENDYIILIYNKMRDTENAIKDDNGKTVYDDSGSNSERKCKGSIVYAFKYNEDIKEIVDE